MTTFLAIGAVSGCIGNSDSDFTQTSGTLSFVADGVDVNLPLESAYDAGTFVGAATSEQFIDGQILAVSQTDTTFAGLLITSDNGTSAETFFGRTAGLGTLPLVQQN